MTKGIIAPSILSADFANLGKEIKTVIEAGADWIHFDVMDNHYVPNLTIGPMVCKAIKPYCSNALIDVHLMVSPVDRMIEEFAAAGADIITFHPEASLHIDRSLALIKSFGLKAGLVFNPATPLSYLEYVWDKIDVVLLMSVNPGFGGQAFIEEMLTKAKQAKKLIDAAGRDVILEIDGGVKIENIAQIAAAGVDAFVAGSAVFNTPDYAKTIAALRAQLNLCN
jgi:ribulose-phosphate 3-epimerase